MAASLAVWATQSLGSKLGIGIGIEFASQIYDVLTNREQKNLIEYDKMVRSQSVDAILRAKMELKNATITVQDSIFKKETFDLSRRFDSLKKKIEYSEAPINEFNEQNRDTISYMNVLIMGKSMSLLDKTRSIVDEQEIEAKRGIVGETVLEIRSTEKYNDLRNMLVKTNEPNILKNLSSMEPELFVDIRNIAGISYKVGTRKTILNQSQFFEDLRGSIILMLDDLMIRRGPIMGLAEMYEEYIKEYPTVEVSDRDFEKAVLQLTDSGYLEDLTINREGYKIVKIKPMKMTDLYHEVINIVGSNQDFISKGVVMEDLLVDLQVEASLLESTLTEMEQSDIAWKHENKYYFPGLSQSALEKRLQMVA